MIDAVELRRFIYDDLIATGFPPRSDRIAERFGVTPSAARDSLAALKIGKAALLDPRSGEIWMAGPFASTRTPYAVRTDAGQWWANCAWDMLGVAAMVGGPVSLSAECTDCGEPFECDLNPGGRVDSDWLVHFLLPARQWYHDIGFT
jgi:hypothetical protein